VGVAFGSTQLLANTHTDTLLIGKQKTGKKKAINISRPIHVPWQAIFALRIRPVVQDKCY